MVLLELKFWKCVFFVHIFLFRFFFEIIVLISRVKCVIFVKKEDIDVFRKKSWKRKA